MKMLVFLIAVALFIVACGPGQQLEATPSPSPTSIPSPMPTAAPSPGVETAPAPIDGVQVEYAPEGSTLVVTSGLPNGCARFKEYQAGYEDGVIKVAVWNTMPTGPDVVCTMVYGYVETRIPLKDVPGVGPVALCQTLAVAANGQRFNVQAAGDAPCPASSLQATLGKRFVLEAGQAASIADERLVITFVKVSQDSRCPLNVMCVWAGEARVMIQVELNGQDMGQQELVLSAGGSPAVISLDKYHLQLLRLDPYPTTAGVAPDDYTATMVVDKAGA